MREEPESINPVTGSGQKVSPTVPLEIQSPGPHWDSVRATIVGRRNVSPRRLEAPGPAPDQLMALIALAGCAPDHGHLTPWRFIEIPAEKRPLLAEVLALSLLDRDPGATLAQLEAAREKACRAPLLLVAVARHSSDGTGVPASERWISLGAALQNLLLGAAAQNWEAGLSSGKALASHRMAELLRLSADETAACFVSLGTCVSPKPRRSSRPLPQELLSSL